MLATAKLPALFALASALVAHANPIQANPANAQSTDDAAMAPLFGNPPSANVLDSYIVVLKSGAALLSADSTGTQDDALHAQHHTRTARSDRARQNIIDKHLDFVRHAHAHDLKRRQMDDASDITIQGLSGVTTGLNHIYSLATEEVVQAFDGYSLLNVSSVLLDQIRARTEVAYIERDQLVWTQDQVSGGYDPDHLAQGNNADINKSAADILTENGAPWGLARISHRLGLTLGTFNKYVYDGRGGEGIDAYVIDTGVRVDHADFEGRATWGKTIPLGDRDEDDHGHGTHCAGTIGGAKYGVAKHVSIYAVKVLRSNGSGSMSDVLAGVIWAAKTASAKFKKGAVKGSVANMSLGGGKSRALDDAVNSAVESGLHFAVAAGNENGDACESSPAAASKAVTVGASTLWDERASFSNWGPCVDIFAPGLNIKSTWNTGNTSTNTISGTSMASPHTCGVMAYLLSLSDGATDDVASGSDDTSFMQQIPSFIARKLPVLAQKIASRYIAPLWSLEPITPSLAPIGKPLSPALLKNTLLELATPNVLKGLDAQSPNLLLFNNITLS